MRLTVLSVVLLAAAPFAAAETPRKPAPKPPAAKPAAPKATPAPPSPALQTEDEKVVYAIGLSIWRSLQPLDLSPAEIELITRALSDSATGKPSTDVPLDTYGPKIDAFGRARIARRTEAEKARSQAFLDQAAQEPGAVKSESGLVYFELQPGTGELPKPTDTVKVNYRGTLVDGTEFDSSYKRGQPAEFALGGVIRCWTEGLQKMKVGGKAKLVCPASIAYGDRGRPSIPGGAALVFEVELLEIKPPIPPAAQAPQAPTAPAASPAAEAPHAPTTPPAPPAPPARPTPAPSPTPN